MKVEIFEDEISCTRYIPFKLELNGDTYGGVLLELVTNVGGFIETDYEIEWNSKEPHVDNLNEIIGKILEQIQRGQI